MARSASASALWTRIRVQRARLFASLAVIAGLGASAAGLLLIIVWPWQHVVSDRAVPLAAIALSAALMPMRAITDVSVMIFRIAYSRGPAIAAQGNLNRSSHLSARL